MQGKNSSLLWELRKIWIRYECRLRTWWNMIISKAIEKNSGVSCSHEKRNSYQHTSANTWLSRCSPEMCWPKSWRLLCWGHLKTLVYSAGVENEETLKQHIFMPVKPSAFAPSNYTTAHDQMCSSVRWCRWRIF
jgi:hypothetical protein